MSEPKVLHEWTDCDGDQWRIIEHRHRSGIELRSAGEDEWFSPNGSEASLRMMAAEILRLRERLNIAPVGEEMTGGQLYSELEGWIVGDTNGVMTFKLTDGDLEFLARKLLSKLPYPLLPEGVTQWP